MTVSDGLLPQAFLEGRWELVMGLEVHAQIAAASKLTSTAPIAFGSEPNTLVEPMDAGLPGMLPSINQACIAQGIRTGLALNGTIHCNTHFDRKHYFYPDLPNGYQITQMHRPIMTQGHLIIQTTQGSKKIRINRLHIEQDAGKTIHDVIPHVSCIDLNRAGIGLMEIVSEPDFQTPEEAVVYAKTLRHLMAYIGSCEGVLAKGQMRVDTNVSIRRPGESLGTRVEIKNLNSFASLHQAIVYEATRQMHLLESGGKVLQQTCLFDDAQGITIPMRSKERAEDYRYFRDPDLLPLSLAPSFVEALQESLPPLPHVLAEEWQKTFRFKAQETDFLVQELEIVTLFQAIEMNLREIIANAEERGRLIYTWIAGELAAQRNRLGSLHIGISPEQFTDLLTLVHQGMISNTMAKSVFLAIWGTEEKPSVYVEKNQLGQISDEARLKPWITQVLADYPENVTAYKAGKEKLFMFFVGKVMALSQGKGHPDRIQELLKHALNQ